MGRSRDEAGKTTAKIFPHTRVAFLVSLGKTGQTAYIKSDGCDSPDHALADADACSSRGCIDLAIAVSSFSRHVCSRSPTFFPAHFMSNGFLGYPASFMLDVVVCALLVVVPLLIFNISVVRWGGNYQLHKRLQLLLAAVLLLAVGLFEVDMQWQGGVNAILAKRARPLNPEELASFRWLLFVHLFFAISTVFLWTATVVLAWRRFPTPARPAAHSRLHKILGWLSALDITGTAVTGLLVYYYGFMVP
ncbi:MAG: DUF420 domain-containing protein [Planctomycetaceae bacterium]